MFKIYEIMLRLKDKKFLYFIF